MEDPEQPALTRKPSEPVPLWKQPAYIAGAVAVIVLLVLLWWVIRT